MRQRGYTHFLVLIFVLVGIGVGLYLVSHPTIFHPKASEESSSSTATNEHIISKTVIDGKPFLYNKASGRIFIPRGSAYDDDPAVSLGNSTMISYNPERIEADLQKMELDGYNSVRTSVRPWTIGNPNGPGLNPVVLDNLVNFLQKAKNHHLFVHLQVGGWPTNPISGYDPSADINDPYRTYKQESYGLNLIDSGYPNYQLLSPQALEARKKFLTDLFKELKARNAPLENIWTYDLGEGELSIKLDAKPFVGVSAHVETNAGSFVIGNMSQEEKLHMIDKSVVNYVNTLTDLIKSFDQTALVSFQIYPPVLHNPPGQTVTNLYVPSKWLMATPDIHEGDLSGVKADVVGLSLYPNANGKNFDCQISSLQIPGVGGKCGYPLRSGLNARPLYVMEMGYNVGGNDPVNEPINTPSRVGPLLLNWMKMECEVGIRGWHLFTWNYTREFGNYFNALEENETINEAIKPVNTPNVCNDDLDSGPQVAENQPNSVPIYAFVNKANPKILFYTASENEKSDLLKTKEWYYGSNTWYSSSKPGTGMKPVYALSLKAFGGVHIYVISDEEKQRFVNSGIWQDNGVVWYSYDRKELPGLIPVVRFKSTPIPTNDIYNGDLLHYLIGQPLDYDEVGKRNMEGLGWSYLNPVWYGTQFYKIQTTQVPGMSPSLNTAQFKFADINKDSKVDVFDLNAFIQDLKTGNLRSDFNSDKKVNIFDFNLFINDYVKF